MEILIISGLSGAGKSRVAALLEDMDFYCVDNMPIEMMPKFAELCLATRGRYEHVALVTDVRALGSSDELFTVLDEMRRIGGAPKIIFVEADVPTIVKRYKETRRRHPLDPESGDIGMAVQREMALLAPLRAQADDIIDTTGLTLSQLQHQLFSRYKAGKEDKPLNVSVKSFGFKYGIPIEADIVLDVRFLPNPFYVNELHDKTGLDPMVRDYVFHFEQTQVFFDKICDLMKFLLPHYIDEGKRYLVVCIGCTGGHHRSVAIASALAAFLAGEDFPVDCIHRDIDKA